MNEMSLGWLIAGAVANLFVSGRWNRAWAAWIAPVLFLLYAHSVPAWTAFTGIWAAIVVSMLISHWRIVPVPALAYPFVLALLAVPTVFPYLADRWLAPQLPGIAGTLVFPLALVSAEYLGARINPFGTWGATAYTQANNRLLVQIVALTGAWGIPFVIGWFASVARWSASQGFAWGTIQSSVLLYAVLLAAVLLYGYWRLRQPSAATQTVTVATIGWPEGVIEAQQIVRFLEPGLPADERAAIQEKFAQIHEHFIARTREAVRAGAKIVVWPETNVMVLRETFPALEKRLKNLMQELGVYGVAGLAVIDPVAEKTRFENRALLFAPDGTVAADYLKTTAVPGFEARFGARGDGRLPVVETPYGRISMAICYDLDFPWLIRQAGQARADLLLVPASDWSAIGSLHHDAARFRAIENGATLVRATRWGISSMVDATGRVVAMLDHNAKPSTVLVAEVPVGNRAGLYARVGDGMAWAGLVAFGLLVASALLR